MNNRCSRCNGYVPFGSQYCGNCGAKLIVTINEEKTKKHIPVAKIVAIFIVLGLICALFYGLYYDYKRKVTASEYNEVHKGMTYDAVIDIVGDYSIRHEINYRDNTQVYVFEGDGEDGDCEVIFYFEDWILVRKEHTGLDGYLIINF